MEVEHVLKVAPAALLVPGLAHRMLDTTHVVPRSRLASATF